MAPARMQADAEIEIENLKSKIGARDAKQKLIDELSDFLDRGISNIWAIIVKNDDELRQITEYWEQWNKDVDKYLEDNFTHSDHIHFSRLGVVPNAMPEHVYAIDDKDIRHWKILREYAVKETRLRDIIRDNRPQVLIT